MRFLETFSALALLIGLSQAADAQTCTPKVPASSLIEAPKWQMSINPTLPPQQFVDDKGELQGLNVELARRSPSASASSRCSCAWTSRR